MRNYLESAVERPAVDELRAVGLVVVKLVRLPGWPDRLVLIPDGTCLFVEFKRPGEGPRPLQGHVRDLLRSYGHEVEVCDSVAGALRAVAARLAAPPWAAARDALLDRARRRDPGG